MKPNKLTLTVALVAVAGMSAFAQSASAQQQAVKVYVQPAVALEHSIAKKYPGKMSPINEVAVVPRVTGVLEKCLFTEGEIVHKGELLYEIEDVTYQAKVDSAKSAIAQLEATQRYVTTNYNRQKTLVESKAVSVSVFDEAEEQLALINAKLIAARADLRDAENTLSYTRIHSPITGKAGKSAIPPGNLVTPSTGTLVTITSASPIYAIFSISERVFREEFGGTEGFKKNAYIRIELADGKIYGEVGVPTIIDPRVDPTTNTVKIWAKFQNTDDVVIPGSYVTVLLSNKGGDGLVGVLPSALQVDQGGTCVYVVNNKGESERRQVTLGSVSDQYQEITSGVAPGEVVIVDGVHKARPGTKVDGVPYNK